MNFEGYELVSLCGFGRRDEKGYWETYSQYLVMPAKQEQYQSLKQFWELSDNDALILLQKCDYLDSGIRDMSFVGLVAKKVDVTDFVEIEMNKIGVIKFNPGVDVGSVVRIKGLDTGTFIKSYLKRLGLDE